jgi:hypothetical protein
LHLRFDRPLPVGDVGLSRLNDWLGEAMGPKRRLTSTLNWFETELLTREDNLVGLMAVNRYGSDRPGQVTALGFRALEGRRSENR